MTAERWTQIKDIFSAALEVPEADHAAYLESACGGDAELRGEVERLLADHATETLSSPAAGLLAQVPELTLGDMLAQYRVEAKLGEGGMGTVYLAYDTRLERHVAVKILLPDPLADPDRKQRLMREARAVSALNHPNIVTVHEVGTAHGVDFIAMEYVEGRSLAKLIPTKGLPVEKALDYAIQTADALAEAHAAGVVHRDLKPANIMVTGEGRVKLLDFGLARRVAMAEGATATLTVPGTVAGTPAYMAPEQVDGKHADQRADIFAFGAVLYEMLSGHRAFEGNSTLAVLGAVLREEPPSLTGVPRELERILRLCLKKEPARRLQNISDVKIELEELSAAEPAPVAPKRRRWFFAATLVVVVAVASVLLALWLRRRAPTAEAPSMVQLTSDSGLTFQPAVSPDGKLVAYSSDRGGGSLDVWVQQMAGGDPIQVTKDPADETEPVFSPEGSQIAFRSEREGGGVYVVPALGGQPRLIAPRGWAPQFSPDGSQIAYGVGRAAPGVGTTAIYVVRSRGGPPRQLHTGLAAVGMPVWTPDGEHVVCKGRSATDRQNDWWVVSVNGGPAIRTRARDALIQHNLWRGTVEARAWVRDGLIFSFDRSDVPDLWQIPISSRTWEVAGQPKRLTFGTGINIRPSVSASGHVVFASMTVKRNVWSVAVDADRGTVRGELQPLTVEAKSSAHPSVSPDGRKVAFVVDSYSRGKQLTIRDLATGKEAAVSGIPPSAGLGYPNFAPDSSKVLFMVYEHSRHLLYVVPAIGGVAEMICESCGYFPALSWDGTKIVCERIGSEGRHYFVSLETATGAATQILMHPEYDFLQPQLCPGDRWISFVCMHQLGRARVIVAPFHGAALIPESEWVTVTDVPGSNIRPHWSPDGNLLYFVSDRDGYRCIWAQRLDRPSKRPLGPPFTVRHFHDPRRLLSDTPELGLSVAPDKLVFNMVEQTSNIWTFRLPEGR